ncbi:MAG: hypothetical protein M1818_006455 [Claussenomyces sp. TS43310]|nr:MAG: hypothetical protein M1818_006455 [Claussenomyces sp. TS43310]
MVHLTETIEDTSWPSPQSLGSNEAMAVPSCEAGTSRKRPTPDHSEADEPAEPVAKRRRTQGSVPVNPEPTPEPLHQAEVNYARLFNDAPQQLLQRTCVLALEHVGFDGASPEALEALCGEVDSYLTKLLSYVTESMLAARRSQTTPLDFEYAMRRAGLTSRLLRPHLKPPIPTSKTCLPYPPADPEEQVPTTMAGLLGKELSGASEMLAKAYIPKHLPSFPSKHTFKTTEVMIEREKDPRKIREEATEAARHGEEALRRLVKVGKSGDHKGPKKTWMKDEKRKRRQDLWEKAMEELAGGVSKNGSTTASFETDEQRIAVDAGKQYWRKAATRQSGLTSRE